MAWSLFTLALLPFFLMTAWVIAARRTNLRKLAPTPMLANYGMAILAEHGLALGQLAAVWRFAFALAGQRVAAGVGALCYAGLVASLFLDAALFTQSGLRLQRSLLSFRNALTEFADERPWRPFIAAVACVFVAAGVSAYHTLSGELTAPSTWPSPVACLAFGVVTSAALEYLRRVLPLDFSYEWDNRLIATERLALLTLWNAIRPSAATLEDALPATLRGGNELSEPIDPAFPLLRRTRGFTGEKTFNLDLAPGEKPHVVFMFLESFRAGDVGILGAPHRNSVTPNFDRLAKDGILWNNFYANGTITSRAMTAAFYGVLPDFHAYSMQASVNPPPVTGMPQLFADAGYHPAFFCDGPMDWENKRDFYLQNGFETFHGSPSIRLRYPEAPIFDWCFPDEYLMRFHAEWLAQQDAKGTPTFSSLLTVTNHTPWLAPDNAPTPDVDVDPRSSYGRYLRTTMYTDQALGVYMDALRANGLDKKTIVIVLGDHGQQVEANKTMEWSGRYNDGSVRVPLLLLAPGRIAPQVIEETASQIDLLPTIMDILGLTGVQHGMGTSLMRRCDIRTAMTIHPWAPGMLSNRAGRYRFVYSFDTHKAALYDLHHDPSEAHDVAALHPMLVTAQKALAKMTRRHVDKLHDGHLFVPADAVPRLGWPRPRHFTPDFPVTYEDCEQRAKELMGRFREGHVESNALHELGVYLMALRQSTVDRPARLMFAQLMLARLRLSDMGEVTRKDIHGLTVLDLMINHTKTAMPIWLRAATETARRIAGLPSTGSQAANQDPASISAPAPWTPPHGLGEAHSHGGGSANQ